MIRPARIIAGSIASPFIVHMQWIRKAKLIAKYLWGNQFIAAEEIENKCQN
jgi:hypothetical protein